MKRFILAAAALTLLSAVTLKAQQTEAFPSYVTVNGFAEREVTPNEIYVRIVINENDSKGKVTVAEQQRKMIDKLRGLGIDVEKNLQVGDMSGDLRNYTFRRDQVQTQKSYVLKVNSADMLGKVFQALADINISEMNLIKATRNDLEQIKAELRMEAMKNAQSIAKSLAGAVGQGIGNAFYIMDNNYGGGGVMYYDSMPIARAKMNASMETAEDTSLNFQNLKLNYSVNVRFVLK